MRSSHKVRTSVMPTAVTIALKLTSFRLKAEIPASECYLAVTDGTEHIYFR